MPFNKNTFVCWADDIKINIKSADRVKIVVADNEISGDKELIKILNVFSEPISIDEGIKKLSRDVKGSTDWIEITSNVKRLYDKGILVDIENKIIRIKSHPGRFDSAPVHIRMLNDRIRTESYQKAIRETVTPNDIVLDIGTGTGILALTAAMAGAKHVYAVERTDMATAAEKIVEKNGVTDKITVINGDSKSIELPEKANILVSEIIGNDPLCEGIISTTHDAVKRHLTAEAKLIPEHLKIFALPVTVPAGKKKKTL